MKCIKYKYRGHNVIRRVPDEVATKIVGDKKAVYCPKKQWKQQVASVTRRAL